MAIYVNTEVEIELDDIVRNNKQEVLSLLGASVPVVGLVQSIYEEVSLPFSLKNQVEEFLQENGGCIFSNVN